MRKVLFGSTIFGRSFAHPFRKVAHLQHLPQEFCNRTNFFFFLHFFFERWLIPSFLIQGKFKKSLGSYQNSHRLLKFEESIRERLHADSYENQKAEGFIKKSMLKIPVRKCCVKSTESEVECFSIAYRMNFSQSFFSRLKNQFQSTGEKRYKCEICDRAFTESSTRTKHMAVHRTEHPFKCGLCDKSFSRKSNLQRHSEIHARDNSNEVGQECPICFKNVTGDFKRHTKYHEMAKIDVVKKYSCDLCSASYNQFNNLKAHMWRHTGQKEYSCDICSKEFSHLSNLKKHMKIHSGDKKYVFYLGGPKMKWSWKPTLLRPNQFPFCSIFRITRFWTVPTVSRYAYPAYPKSKLQNFYRFVCDVCPRAFVIRSLLRRHLRTHSAEKKEKNFLCDLCSKAFTESASLHCHMLTHTGSHSVLFFAQKNKFHFENA